MDINTFPVLADTLTHKCLSTGYTVPLKNKLPVMSHFRCYAINVVRHMICAACYVVASRTTWLA